MSNSKVKKHQKRSFYISSWRVLIFILGFYTAIYGIANQQFANETSAFQTKIDRFYNTNSTFNNNYSISDLIQLQNTKLPPEPSFFKPILTMKCFFGIKSTTNSIKEISSIILKPIERLINEGQTYNVSVENVIIEEQEELLIGKSFTETVNLTGAVIPKIRFGGADLELRCDKAAFDQFILGDSSIKIEGDIKSNTLTIRNSITHIEDLIESQTIDVSWSLLNKKSDSISSLEARKLNVACSLIANLNIKADTIQGSGGCTTYFYNCLFSETTYFDYIYASPNGFNHGETPFIFYNCKIGSEAISNVESEEFYSSIEDFGFKNFNMVDAFYLEEDSFITLESLTYFDRDVFLLDINTTLDSSMYSLLDSVLSQKVLKFEFK